MDVTNLMLGDSVTVDVVKSSPTKALVILSGGVMKAMKDGNMKLSLLVEMDGRQLNWVPNKTTMKNLAEAFRSPLSEMWVGKKVTLFVENVKGRDAVIGKVNNLPC